MKRQSAKRYKFKLEHKDLAVSRKIYCNNIKCSLKQTAFLALTTSTIFLIDSPHFGKTNDAFDS